jgi:hypothetical protein
MSKGPWTPLYCPAWFVQAAEVMVRNNTSLKVAALEVGHPLDGDEADKVSRRKDFQEILRSEANKHYAAVANDPTRTKSVVLGKLWMLADRLMAEEEHEKAAGVLDKLAKVEGWSGNEGNINIFSGLTARDIDEARAKLAGSGKRTSKYAKTVSEGTGEVGVTEAGTLAN